MRDKPKAMATVTGRESVERFEWEEAQGGNRRDLFRGSFRASVAGEPCPGVRVVRGRGDAGEAPEGNLSSHTVVVNLGGSTHQEFSWAGAAWERLPVAHSAVHFLPAHAPHAVRWREPVDSLVVEISPDFVAAVARTEPWSQRIELRPAVATENRFLAHAAMALAEETAAGSPGGPLCAESLASAIARHLLRTRGELRPWVHRSEALGRAQLARVLAYIGDHLDTDLVLRDLATVAQMDRFRFSRAFKQSVGLPPHRYVLLARIERAKALLAKRRVSISEVALSTGFATPSHFATTFRRMTRVTPREFRDGQR